jgi:hypothetical protein
MHALIKSVAGQKGPTCSCNPGAGYEEDKTHDFCCFRAIRTINPDFKLKFSIFVLIMFNTALFADANCQL